jgi:hypothetical protein
LTSIWDNYPALTEAELRNLVAAAAQVLAAGADHADVPDDVLEISDSAAARELAAPATGLGEFKPAEIRQVLEDDEASAELSRAVLDEVRKYPALADEVAEAYEERSRKMAGAEMLLLAGAIVVLAIRIKEIRIGKGQTRITFAESGDAVKAFLAGLLSGLGK